MIRGHGGENCQKIPLVGVVVRELLFYLFIGGKSVSNELFRLIEYVGRGNVFALLIDAVFRNQEECLRLYRVLLQKMHVLDIVARGNEFPDLLHFAL